MQEFLAANPDAKLISLGIGDTTHPMPAAIAEAMAAYAKGLGTLEGSQSVARALSPLSLPRPPSISRWLAHSLLSEATQGNGVVMKTYGSAWQCPCKYSVTSSLLCT
jgi:hypothetical protein